MKIVLTNAALQVGVAPGIRVLSIKDPTLAAAGIELEVVLSSFNAAEAARHLVQGDDAEQPAQTRELALVDARGDKILA